MITSGTHGARGTETTTVRAIGGDGMMIETVVMQTDGDQTGEMMIDVEREDQAL